MNYKAILKFFLIILFALFNNLAMAQEANNQTKKNFDVPIFMSPNAFIQQNFLTAKDRYEELKKKYNAECGSFINQSKINAESKTVQGIVGMLPELKSLKFTIPPLYNEAKQVTPTPTGNTDYFFVLPDMSKIKKLGDNIADLYTSAPVWFKLIDIGSDGNEHSDGLPLQAKLVDSGPFIPSGRFIHYIGGVGKNTIRWTSPVTNFTHQETFTANAVDAEFDPEMSDNEVAPGGKYTVKIIVFGSIDMTPFKLSWSIDGPAKWQNTTTTFTRQSDIWISTNTLEVNSVSDIKANFKKEKISFKAILPPTERANGFTLRRDLIVNNVPPAEELILMTKYGNEPPEKLKEINLFYPNARRQNIKLMPFVRLRGIKDPIFIADLPVPISVEFESKNPNAADVGLQGNLTTKSIYSDEGEIIAKITGRLGSEKTQIIELGDRKSKLTDNVFVYVNVLLLSSKTNKDGKNEYTLIASGPTDMSKYTVRWFEKGFLGTNKYDTSFSPDGQAYVSKLTTGSNIENVQIIQGNRVLAEITSASGAISQSVSITLLPSSPPTAIVKKIENENDFASYSECISEVSRWMDMFGFDPGKSAEGYCKDKMKSQAQSAQLAQAQNQYIKELNAKGYELVTFSDEMKVGALVVGLKKEYENRTVCKWYLKTDTKLYLETDTTPVQTDNIGIGGCFNKVKGIKEHFDPNAEISVELVLDTTMPNYPLFIESNTIQLFSNMLGR